MIEWHLLEEGRAHALGEAAMYLPIDNHRIDQLAAVLHDDVIDNLHVPCLGIHRDEGGMRGIAESAGIARRFVSGRDLEAAGVDIGRKVLRPQVPGARDLGEPDRSAWAARRWPPAMRTFVGSVCKSRAPILAARAAISLQALATAPPAMTMQREPQVPVEYGVSACRPARS